MWGHSFIIITVIINNVAEKNAGIINYDKIISETIAVD